MRRLLALLLTLLLPARRPGCELGGGSRARSARPRSAPRRRGTTRCRACSRRIAKAESGRPIPPLPGLQPWPWAINADGAARYFDSKPAAVAWTRLALDRGVRQIDVGCMQINLQSHPTAFRDLDEAFDPAANADYAARFLTRAARRCRRQLVHGGRLLPFAHAGTGRRLPRAGRRDRRRAARRRRASACRCTCGRSSRARCGSPLAGGGVLRINLRRQPTLRGPRRMSACQVAAVLGDFMPRARAPALRVPRLRRVRWSVGFAARNCAMVPADGDVDGLDLAGDAPSNCLFIPV